MRLEIAEILPAEPVQGWSIPAVAVNKYASLTDLLPSLRAFQDALCPRSRARMVMPRPPALVAVTFGYSSRMTKGWQASAHPPKCTEAGSGLSEVDFRLKPSGEWPR